MRFGEIRNLPVVGVATAEKLGSVDDLLLDQSGRQVLGFRVRRGGLIVHHEGMLLADVQSIGNDAVVVRDASRLNKLEKFSEFSNSRLGSGIVGSRVVTEAGENLGSVGDIDADFNSGAVQRFALGGNVLERLRGQHHSFSVDTVQSIGNDLVVVGNDAVVA